MDGGPWAPVSCCHSSGAGEVTFLPFTDSTGRCKRCRICLKPHDGGRAEHTELLGTVRRDEEQPVTWLPWLAGEGRHATARSALHPAPKEKLEALQAGSPYYQHSGPLSSKEVCSLPSLRGNLGAGKLASLGRAGLLPTRAQERMGAST